MYHSIVSKNKHHLNSLLACLPMDHHSDKNNVASMPVFSGVIPGLLFHKLYKTSSNIASPAIETGRHRCISLSIQMFMSRARDCRNHLAIGSFS